MKPILRTMKTRVVWQGRALCGDAPTTFRIVCVHRGDIEVERLQLDLMGGESWRNVSAGTSAADAYAERAALEAAVLALSGNEPREGVE